MRRGEDVDARVEQLLDVLPALQVPRAGRVGVRQLVDQDQLRSPAKRSVEVELLDLDPAVIDDPARQELEADEERAGVVPAVRLGDPDDHVALLVLRLEPGGLQHRVRLAHARGRPEEDGELAARGLRFVFADAREQLVGVRPFFGHQGLLAHRSSATSRRARG